LSEDLLLYAQLGRADRIRRLVASGVDPDWRREDGVTTLMMAAMTGRLEVMIALLDAGATVDLQAPDGTTALLAACTYARTTRELDGLELLLSRGASPLLANGEGNDPLMVCARHGLVPAVVALLRAGADPRRANRHGTTALMQAARGHLVETVRVLLEAGAALDARDTRGLDAVSYAHELGPPPPALRRCLARAPRSPHERPEPLCTFATLDYELTLLGAWSEATADTFVDDSQARRITVGITRLPAELEADERHDALARNARAGVDMWLRALPAARSSPVRLLDAGPTTQARFAVTAPEVFIAVCTYAVPDRFVTLTYRDERPGELTEEARRRQAGESVASFRVK